MFRHSRVKSQCLLPLVARRGIIGVILLLCSVQIQAQLILQRQVIAPFNLLSTASDGTNYAITAGQSAFLTETSSTHQLTQGFHQPDKQFCPGDFNGNGLVESYDLLILLASYGCSNNPACNDINQDGIFNVIDVILFVGLMGQACE